MPTEPYIAAARRRPPEWGEWGMECIGIDVHKRDSQVCILGEGGVVVLGKPPVQPNW